MRYSLTLSDRDMFVAGAEAEVRGYVIAQPIAALLMPAAHAGETVGVVDDFYDEDFADVAVASHDGATARKLLSAAESAFARRGFTSALAVVRPPGHQRSQHCNAAAIAAPSCGS